MSKHQCSIGICLDDLRHATAWQIGRAFEAIENCKAAIRAKSCKVADITFSNEPNRINNPRGDMQTITFDVLTPFEGETCELELKHYRLNDRLNGNEHQVDMVPLVEFKVNFAKLDAS